MSSFNRRDYLAVFAFARQQYYWHESTGRGFDITAALVMSHIEDVIGQQSNFPVEARERLAEVPNAVKTRKWSSLAAQMEP